jgi:hypothetical protein
MIAASAAVFAGWMAWNAVQDQIASENRRLAIEKEDVESVLQVDLDYFGEGLGVVWILLQALANEKLSAEDEQKAFSGIKFGITKIADSARLQTSRKMAAILGWKRRRQYEQLFDAIEVLGQYRTMNTFQVSDAEVAANRAADWFETLRPQLQKAFGGLRYRPDVRFSPRRHLPLGTAIIQEAGLFGSDSPIEKKWRGE